MISVTRFNDSTLIINADLIQTVEETPDTVITLTTGTKFIVKEKSKEIVDKVVAVSYTHLRAHET